MKSICDRTRVTDPAGIWDYKNMIGAQVRISSMPVSNLNRLFAFDDTTIHTISDVYFRVTTDGKTITIVRLSDMPDYLFTFKDLEVLNLKLYEKAICGWGCCGNVICGDL